MHNAVKNLAFPPHSRALLSYRSSARLSHAHASAPPKFAGRLGMTGGLRIRTRNDALKDSLHEA